MIERIIKLTEERNSFLLFLALIAGIANYFYKNLKGEVWNFRIFFMNTGLALFVGYRVSIIIPDTLGDMEKIIVMMCAFTARDILGIIEMTIPKIVENKINNLANNIETNDGNN